MTSIDERVVALKFDNAQFENGVKQSTSSLDNLKKGLNLDGAKKSLDGLNDSGNRFSLANVAAGVESISSKFTALGVIGITALANIANKAVDAGTTLIRSLTIDPIKAGLEEYQTNLNAIQTILSNTQSKGTNLDDVNGALQELNLYSDKTIYNFSQMARNIGTFTAAGVDLDTSVQAIKGIANLAAVSGSNADQASTAMYQLSQALASGKVSLMDWNSVVNAGMGGQVFQDALKETARTQGVAIDDIIAKNGSFRDSLQEGWLTSDILNNTLAKFTGDLNEEQLRAQGYTEDQIASIIQLGKTAQDAATKVKTLPQLIGTLQESVGSGWSQTFQTVLGDFDEAKSLFTGVNNILGGMIQASSNARNGMLSDWKELGGRTAAIDAVRNAFNALMAIFNPIKEAFQQIFPPMTGEQLANITKAIRDFTANLIIGGSTADNIKRTFAGVFAILDIGWQIVKGLVGVLVKLFGATTEGSGGILVFTARIGDFLVNLDQAIKKGNGLTKFFDTLGSVLAVPIGLFKSFVGLIAAWFASLNGSDTSGFEAALGRVKVRLQPLIDLGNGLASLFGALGGILAKVWTVVGPIVSAIGTALAGLGKAIASGISSGDFSGVLDIINTGLFAGIFLLVKKFLGNPINIPGGGFIDSIKGIFGGLTDTLSAMQGQLKAKTLMEIAIAVGILAVSLVALSLIDSGKLAVSLGAITVMFGELLAAMAILDKVTSSKGFIKIPVVAAGMIALSIAMVILASAVAILATMDWNELARGLVGLAAGMAIMTVAANFLPTNLIVTGAGLIAAAIGVTILAGALKIMSTLSWDDIGRSMVALGGSLAILAVGLTLMTASLPGAGALIIAAAGIVLLALALQMMAKLSWDDIGRSMVALGGSLVILAIGLTAMDFALPGAAALVVASAGLVVLAFALGQLSKLSWDDIGRAMVLLGGSLVIMAVGLTAMMLAMPGAAALVVASAALVVLAGALKLMSGLSWDEIGKAMVVLGGSLLILAIGLTLMIAALPGAAALTVAAVALGVLAPVLKLMGGMSWDEIGRGLTVLAASLLIIAIAGIAILPAIPGLLGLGAAALLLGLGALAAGVGILAFSVGLTALSVAGAAGAIGITAILSAIIGLIPTAMTALANGIIAFAGVIANSGPAMIAAMTTVIISLVTAIQTAGPQIITTLTDILLRLIAALSVLIPPATALATEMIISFVNAMIVLIPLVADAGLQIVVGILNAIANNIGDVVQAGVNIVTSFIDGVAAALPQLIDSGINLVISFVNSLADGIREHTSEMNAAGQNLAEAIIDGMTSGIRGGIDAIIGAAQHVAQAALDGAKALLGINSPSKEFHDIGMYSDQGLANGLDRYSSLVEKSAANVGSTALTSLSASMAGVGDAVSANMDITPTITPVLDLSSVKNTATQLSGIVNGQKIVLDKVYADAVSATPTTTKVTETSYSEDPNDPTKRYGRTITYNQYNNSPKALSPADIYRQTKNQISSVKDALSI